MSDTIETYVQLPDGGCARVVDGSLTYLHCPPEYAQPSVSYDSC